MLTFCDELVTEKVPLSSTGLFVRLEVSDVGSLSSTMCVCHGRVDGRRLTKSKDVWGVLLGLLDVQNHVSQPGSFPAVNLTKPPKSTTSGLSVNGYTAYLGTFLRLVSGILE